MPRKLEMENEQAPFDDIFKKTGIGHQMQSVIEDSFTKPFTDAAGYCKSASKIHVRGEDDTKSMEAAGVIHKAVREVRLTTEKVRKTLKDESLRTGQAIDAAARKIKGMIEPVEQVMKEAATYAETMRARRMAELEAKRQAELDNLEWDHTSYDLAMMPEDQYLRILNTAKAAHKELLEERERQRIADLEEAERLRIENEELRRKAEEADKLRRESEAKQREQAEKDAQRVALEKRGRLQREREEARVRSLSDAGKVSRYLDEIMAVEIPDLTGEVQTEILQPFNERLQEIVDWARGELENFSKNN